MIIPLIWAQNNSTLQFNYFCIYTMECLSASHAQIFTTFTQSYKMGKAFSTKFTALRMDIHGSYLSSILKNSTGRERKRELHD